MLAVKTVPRTVTADRPVSRLGTWSHLSFVAAFAAYIGGAAFVVGANLVNGDALSRVENAQRVLLSRDPHLAAIGFVWSPLPSLVLVPFTLLKPIWPGLIESGFIGNIASALWMAGGVYVLVRILEEMGLPTSTRVALTIAFALNPAIFYAGASGLSEAPALFFSLLAVRYLLRWMRIPTVASLFYAGGALGFAYMCRYEPIVAGLASMAAVMVVSYWRASGGRRERIDVAISDVLILGGPFVLAVVLWAGTSWLIVGHPFEQFASVYGTAAQMKAIGGVAVEPLGIAVARGVEAALALAPFLPLGILFSGYVAFRRRDPQVLAILAVFGCMLCFMFWAYTSGTVLRSIRYLIMGIPLATLLAAMLLRGVPRSTVDTEPRFNWLRGAAPLVAFSGLALAVGTSMLGMFSVNLNLLADANAFLALKQKVTRPSGDPSAIPALRRFDTERQIARYIDDRVLPRGSVLVDDFLGFEIVLASARPDVFVISSDHDFNQSLDDLPGSGIRYVLVPSPTLEGQLDAVVRAYPNLYDTGAGIGELTQFFPRLADSGADWKLYRIVATPQ